MSAAHNTAKGTVLRRLAGTPARDLLRGRVTGRLDIDLLLERSGLPTPLTDVVRRTVRATRLLRLEKADVASELAAHFRDGLEAGETAAALAERFGDERSAARLIRRAKKRDRGLALRATILAAKGTVALLVFAALLYGGLAARYMSVKHGPVIDRRPELLAAAARVPEADSAWPVYRAAMLEHGEAIRTLNLRARPGWRDWPAVEVFLNSNRDLLGAVRRGAAMPGMGHVPGPPFAPEDLRLWPGNGDGALAGDAMSGSLVEVLLPYLAEVRLLAGALGADARLAVAQGDGERLDADLLALLGLAQQTREIPLLLNDLVAMAMARLAIEELTIALAERPEMLTREQLATLAHALDAFPRDGEPLVRLGGERLLFEDTVQRMYSLDADGDGVFVGEAMESFESLSGSAGRPKSPFERLAAPVTAAVFAGRAATLRFYDDLLDRVVAWANRPAWERGEFVAADELFGSAVARARYALPAVLTPSFDHAMLEAESFAQRRDAALAVIAVELFRRREGRPPASLSELAPDLLPRVPLDMFDGGPLKYLVDGEAYTLYSVGNDYVDDAGRRSAYASVWRAKSTVEDLVARTRSGDVDLVRRTLAGQRAPGIADGDWVFFPPLAPEEPRAAPLDDLP